MIHDNDVYNFYKRRRRQDISSKVLKYPLNNEEKERYKEIVKKDDNKVITIKEFIKDETNF